MILEAALIPYNNPTQKQKMLLQSSSSSMSSPSLLLLQHHHQGLSHFQSLLPLVSLKLKPHKLSLQAVVQRFNEPDLNTSIPATKSNAARLPKSQADGPKGIANANPHLYKVPE
ncbi:uncharacterized protein LOC21399494 [Morus notabilis]|uniref:uncharacterized protein LOC21399494 n=1 Tax=Morus notabilis TaxID=981085 RepID=UPI000CED7AA6|nr:uncharacterized protein LOC21399494 [Morus notabilis]